MPLELLHRHLHDLAALAQPMFQCADEPQVGIRQRVPILGRVRVAGIWIRSALRWGQIIIVIIIIIITININIIIINALIFQK